MARMQQRGTGWKFGYTHPLSAQAVEDGRGGGSMRPSHTRMEETRVPVPWSTDRRLYNDAEGEENGAGDDRTMRKKEVEETHKRRTVDGPNAMISSHR